MERWVMMLVQEAACKLQIWVGKLECQEAQCKDARNAHVLGLLSSAAQAGPALWQGRVLQPLLEQPTGWTRWWSPSALHGASAVTHAGGVVWTEWERKKVFAALENTKKQCGEVGSLTLKVQQLLKPAIKPPAS
eukprot:TRINITY_DN54543_c0_g1_i1.p3 TRINITY_DN54543_c0_g1~~TRINITY_DN54543_c0_g1_i1.p3  ORF type:complete len:134 (+),score=12.66 TRINITY_DN54543_c0_g1_i1:584-985(+)